MTAKKKLKRKIRQRMEATGESYSAALRFFAKELADRTRLRATPDGEYIDEEAGPE